MQSLIRGIFSLPWVSIINNSSELNHSHSLLGNVSINVSETYVTNASTIIQNVLDDSCSNLVHINSLDSNNIIITKLCRDIGFSVVPADMK